MSNITGNTALTSITYAPSGGITRDASESEKVEGPVIDIEGLRGISRIVQTIRARIGSSERCNSGAEPQQYGVGDPSSPETTRSNRSTTAKY
jgi:hypothetical protein